MLDPEVLIQRLLLNLWRDHARPNFPVKRFFTRPAKGQCSNKCGYEMMFA